MRDEDQAATWAEGEGDSFPVFLIRCILSAERNLLPVSVLEVAAAQSSV